jgi:hypothetical protein
MNRLEKLLSSRELMEGGAYALTILDKYREHDYGEYIAFTSSLDSLGRKLDSSESFGKKFATTNKERKELIQKGINYWYAAGALPVIYWKDGLVDIVANYRDFQAPSWPDAFNVSAGLPRLTRDGKQEKIKEVMEREPSEEVVFADPNVVEVKPRFKDFASGAYKIHVMYDGQEIDTADAWEVDWGTSYDPVTCIVGLRVYYPDAKRGELSVFNGEIIPDKKSSRDLYLFDLSEVRFGYKINGRGYSIKVDEDRISYFERPLAYEDMHMVSIFRKSIERIRENYSKFRRTIE